MAVLSLGGLTLEKDGSVNWKFKELDIAYNIVSGKPEWFITDYSEIKNYHDFELAVGQEGAPVILTSNNGQNILSFVWDYDDATGGYKFQKITVETLSPKTYLRCESFVLTKDSEINYSSTKYELTTNS